MSPARRSTLAFFAQRGHRQVIAGYYDSDPARVRDWLAAARAHPDSVQGIMYTTWKQDYRQLETFSREVDASR